jgi:hypothetical protein
MGQPETTTFFNKLTKCLHSDTMDSDTIDESDIHIRYISAAAGPTVTLALMLTRILTLTLTFTLHPSPFTLH